MNAKYKFKTISGLVLVTVLMLAMILTSDARAAQVNAAITAIDPRNNVVTAKVSQTGQIFQFKPGNPTVLNSLKVGQIVFADFTVNQVSLDKRSFCCGIVNAGTVSAGVKPVSPALKTNAPVTPPAATPVTPPVPVASVYQPPPLSQPLPPIAERKGFTLTKQSARPYVPFDLKDPKTGRAPINPKTGMVVTPETQITLPNGKTMTVKKYLDQINILERQFNALGYSLRDKPLAPVKLGKPSVSRTLLQGQASSVVTKHLKIMGPRPDVQNEIRQLSISGFKRTGTGLVSLINIEPVNPALIFCRSAKVPWDLPMGDPDSFYVNLNGELRLRGCSKDGTGFKTGTAVNGLGKADISIVGQRLEMVRVTAGLNSPKSEPVTASLDLRIFGNSISVLNDSSVTLKTWEGTKSQPIYYGYKTRFTVGPVPMSVVVGARGVGGIKYSVVLQPGEVAGGVTPFAHSEAFVELNAVDVEVVSAGIGGKMTLLNDDLDIKAIAQLQFDQQLKPHLWLDYYAFNTMESLSGGLYLKACVNVPADGWQVWNWEEKCYTHDLWDWEGIKVTDYLFRNTQQVDLPS